MMSLSSWKIRVRKIMSRQSRLLERSSSIDYFSRTSEHDFGKPLLKNGTEYLYWISNFHLDSFAFPFHIMDVREWVRKEVGYRYAFRHPPRFAFLSLLFTSCIVYTNMRVSSENATCRQPVFHVFPVCRRCVSTLHWARHELQHLYTWIVTPTTNENFPLLLAQLNYILLFICFLDKSTK